MSELKTGLKKSNAQAAKYNDLIDKLATKKPPQED